MELGWMDTIERKALIGTLMIAGSRARGCGEGATVDLKASPCAVERRLAPMTAAPCFSCEGWIRTIQAEILTKSVDDAAETISNGESKSLLDLDERWLLLVLKVSTM